MNVRYPRELRDDLARLGEVLVLTPRGAQVPIAQLAELKTVQGPSMVRKKTVKAASLRRLKVWR